MLQGIYPNASVAGKSVLVPTSLPISQLELKADAARIALTLYRIVSLLGQTED